MRLKHPSTINFNNRQRRPTKHKHHKIFTIAEKRIDCIRELQWKIIHSRNEPNRRFITLDVELWKRLIVEIVWDHVAELWGKGVLGVRRNHEVAKLGTRVRKRPIRTQINAGETGKTHGAKCACCLPKNHWLRMGSYYLLAILHHYTPL